MRGVGASSFPCRAAKAISVWREGWPDFAMPYSKTQSACGSGSLMHFHAPERLKPLEKVNDRCYGSFVSRSVAVLVARIAPVEESGCLCRVFEEEWND